jgi:hypothetical protein
MEKSQKSKSMKNKKQKQNADSDSDDHTLSSHSILSINPNESLGNNIAHNLFILAGKQAREERQQAKLRQKNQKRQTILIKRKKLTINDIDRLFEEKRVRPSTIKNDLIDLYQKSTGRIRSMLDIHQIDQFIQTIQNRKIL